MDFRVWFQATDVQGSVPAFKRRELSRFVQSVDTPQQQGLVQFFGVEFIYSVLGVSSG